MIIRETTTVTSDTTAFDQAEIMAAIAKLDALYRDGEIESATYFSQKRTLIKML